MPKDRRVSSSSFERAMVSPYSSCLKISDGSGGSTSLVGDEKEWEEARCPICMEHPHNAVLLRCSSREKGCHPFVCDTSYRHSNCLDQLRKSADVSSLQSPFDQLIRDLVCPLCRGSVTGWDVIYPARKFMDSKTRSCSLETCSFNGNYAELRKHARLEHPFGRPSEASPNRQLNWAALERQRDMEDVLALESDIMYDFDAWWDYIWNDESFFDFSSGMSDIENDSIDELLSSLTMTFSLCPSSPDETVDFESSRNSERPPRSVLPTNSNNHVGYISNTSRPISRNHSEEESADSRLDFRYHRASDSMHRRTISDFDRENGLTNLNLNSDYHREYVSRSSRRRRSYHRGNASTNLRSISSYRREYAPYNVSSRSDYNRDARLRYPRENGWTASRSRSSYYRRNDPSSSRARQSYRREDVWPSSSSRARATFHPREEPYSPVSGNYSQRSSRMSPYRRGRRHG